MTEAEFAELYEHRLRAFHDDAAGVIGGLIFRMRDGGAWAAATLDGDANAGAAVSMIQTWLREVPRMPQRPLCIGCDAELDATAARFPAGFFLILPHRANPRMGMVCPICPRCSRKADEEIFAGAVVAIGGIWPELRRIDPAALSGDGGQA